MASHDLDRAIDQLRQALRDLSAALLSQTTVTSSAVVVQAVAQLADELAVMRERLDALEAAQLAPDDDAAVG